MMRERWVVPLNGLNKGDVGGELGSRVGMFGVLRKFETIRRARSCAGMGNGVWVVCVLCFFFLGNGEIGLLFGWLSGGMGGSGKRENMRCTSGM